MDRLILASASPRRRELLENIGLKFDIIVSSENEENIDDTLPPKLYTSELAVLKANSVAKKLIEEGRQKGIIIAADTVVYLDEKILGKPKNKEDAFLMLNSLSGRIHSVYTGICVLRLYDGFIVSASVRTDVKFKDIDEKLIRKYIDTNEPMDKAGAYGIQGRGSLLVEKIDGDYFNVVGLPVSTLCEILKNEFNVDIL